MPDTGDHSFPSMYRAKVVTDNFTAMITRDNIVQFVGDILVNAETGTLVPEFFPEEMCGKNRDIHFNAHVKYAIEGGTEGMFFGQVRVSPNGSLLINSYMVAANGILTLTPSSNKLTVTRILAAGICYNIGNRYYS